MCVAVRRMFYDRESAIKVTIEEYCTLSLYCAKMFVKSAANVNSSTDTSIKDTEMAVKTVHIRTCRNFVEVELT